MDQIKNDFNIQEIFLKKNLKIKNKNTSIYKYENLLKIIYNYTNHN